MGTKSMKRTPEEKARLKRIQELLDTFDVKDPTSLRDFIGQIMTSFLEGSLNAELSEQLGYEHYERKPQSTKNSRNGYSKKKLRTTVGPIELKTPRDRLGEFEPQVIKKNQTCVTPEVENGILSMYARGMTTRDIRASIQDIYKLDISESLVSMITDQVLTEAREWQSRPLEQLYAFVFIDAVHFTVRSEGRLVKKAVYVAIGYNMDGRKDVLGLWIGEHESAKYWLTVLNEMRERGVEDILIICTDNLTGLSEAIEAVFPKTAIQNCIIHQMRNSIKYTADKDRRAVISDLKTVCHALTEKEAELALDNFSAKWDKKYPMISQSWRRNWEHLATFFNFNPTIRRLIYTTNTIEGFNRQLRKVTKTRSVFPTDDSLFKLLYMATKNITAKWKMSAPRWGEIRRELILTYGSRIPD